METSKPIKPLGGYIMVSEIKETARPGELLIPDTLKLLHQKGTVISVSDEVDTVEVGDTVYYSKNNIFHS